MGRLNSGRYKVFSSDTVPVNLIPRLRRVKNNLTHWALSSYNKFFLLLTTLMCCIHSLLLFHLLAWKDTSAQALINGVRFCDAPCVICRHCPSTKGMGAFDELTVQARDSPPGATAGRPTTPLTAFSSPYRTLLPICQMDYIYHQKEMSFCSPNFGL